MTDAIEQKEATETPKHKGGKPARTGLPPAQAKDESEVLSLLGGISEGLKAINERIDGIEGKVIDIETGGANKFKEAAKLEDIATASELRKGIDPKISTIVDEMLGVDFGAEVKSLGDRPGYRFTVIVPNRLSDNVVDKRPVMEVDKDGNPTGNYVKDSLGNVVFQDYIPEDRRSRILSSSDSYDAIKNHCEKVRGYIVAHFQKVSKPLPEFKVK